MPAARLRRRPARAASRRKAGGCARTAAASGPVSSSTRSAIEAGELIGFAKITRDIPSERKRPQETLQQSEERFRLLVQGVTDYAIYMLDPEGKVTNWNPGAERIKGYTERGDRRTPFLANSTRPRTVQAGLPIQALATAATRRPL